jgi:hypothetical protein
LNYDVIVELKPTHHHATRQSHVMALRTLSNISHVVASRDSERQRDWHLPVAEGGPDHHIGTALDNKNK